MLTSGKYAQMLPQTVNRRTYIRPVKESRDVKSILVVLVDCFYRPCKYASKPPHAKMAEIQSA